MIEQFKRCIHDDLKTYLDEKNVETLHEVAALADDYVFSFKQKQRGFSKSNGFVVSDSGEAPTGVSSGSNAGNKPCYD